MSEQLCDGYEGDDEVMSMDADDVGSPGTEQLHDDSEDIIDSTPTVI